MMLFISYSSIDEPFVRELVHNLNLLKIDSQMEVRGLDRSEHLPSSVASAIEVADGFVVVLGADDLDSGRDANEIEIAMAQREKRGADYKVVPILLPPIDQSALSLWFPPDTPAIVASPDPGGAVGVMPDVIRALDLEHTNYTPPREPAAAAGSVGSAKIGSTSASGQDGTKTVSRRPVVHGQDVRTSYSISQTVILALRWAAALAHVSSVRNILDTKIMLGGFLLLARHSAASYDETETHVFLSHWLSNVEHVAPHKDARLFDVYEFCEMAEGVDYDKELRPHRGPIDNLSLHASEAMRAAEDYAARVNNYRHSQPEIHARHLIAALVTAPGSATPFYVQKKLIREGYDLLRLRTDMFDFVSRVMPGREDITAWKSILISPDSIGLDQSTRSATEQKPVASVGLPTSRVRDHDATLGELSVDSPNDNKTPVATYRTDGIGADDKQEASDLLAIRREVNALCSVLVARHVKPPISVGLFGDWGTGKSFFMRQMTGRIEQIAEAAKEAEDRQDETAFCSHVVQIEFNAWHYLDDNLWASLMTRILGQLCETIDKNNEDSEAKRIALFSKLKSSEDALEIKKQARNEAESALLTAENRVLTLRESVQEVRAAVIEQVLSDKSVSETLDQLGAQGKAVREDLNNLTQSGKSIYSLYLTARSSFFADRGQVMRLIVSAVTGAAVVFVVARLLAWSKPATYGGPAIMALGTILTVWKSWTSKAQAVLKPLIKRIQDASHQRTDQLRDNVAAAESEVVKLKETVKALGNEIIDISAGRRLGKFLEERASSKDYRQYQGIIARIRSDFERLSALLCEAGHEVGSVGGVAAVHFAPANLPRIDRIILYIDDLDRCPADRVVDVLQAVHLLLAFPLFVVVVGVDSRWMLNALRKHYKEFLGYTEDSMNRTTVNDQLIASTPQNYLEKIFQIPYTLRPMNDKGFRAVVQALVPVSEAEGAAVVPGLPGKPSPTSDRSEFKAPSLAEATGRQPKDDLAISQGPPDTARSLPELRVAGVSINPDPPSLKIKPWERVAMQNLAPLVSSPRSAKRLINIYSLLRASIEESETLQDFVGNAEQGEYQAALILLALQIRFPDHAGSIFSAVLNAEPEVEWWSFVDELTPAKIDGAGSTERYGNIADKDMGAEEHDTWLEIVGRLEGVKSSFETTPDMKVFQGQVKYVARFSFQTGSVLSQWRKGG